LIEGKNADSDSDSNSDDNSDLFVRDEQNSQESFMPGSSDDEHDPSRDISGEVGDRMDVHRAEPPIQPDRQDSAGHASLREITIRRKRNVRTSAERARSNISHYLEVEASLLNGFESGKSIVDAPSGYQDPSGLRSNERSRGQTSNKGLPYGYPGGDEQDDEELNYPTIKAKKHWPEQETCQPRLAAGPANANLLERIKEEYDDIKTEEGEFLEGNISLSPTPTDSG
jgi:hypothetical protein